MNPARPMNPAREGEDEAPAEAAPSISLRATAAALVRGWNRFFHGPCDARVCAAIRITYALIVLAHFGVLYPDLDLFFTESGELPIEAARKVVSPFSTVTVGKEGEEADNRRLLSLLELVPQTSTAVHVCWWIAVVHAVLLLVGLSPRLNALFLFMWVVSFQVRNDLINDGEDRMMRVLCFFLIWLPSGRCWSVNALVRRFWFANSALRTPHSALCLAPAWPLRLLQIEMAAMFFSSGLVKLSGQSWLNGTALYYVSRLDDHFGRFPVPAWAFDSPWCIALMTWSVLLAELAVPFLIWFRETRIPCLIIVLFFHLANEWTMNLFLFHPLMICGWLSFVTAADFWWLGIGRSSRSSQSTAEELIAAKVS
jgi:hypothetical protein